MRIKLLKGRVMLEFLARVARVVGNGSAFLALLSLAVSLLADETVFSVMLLVFCSQSLARLVFLGGVARIPGGELVLAVAFHALHDVHHVPDSLILHLLVLLLPQQTLR